MTGVATVVEVATACYKSPGNCRMKIPSPPALIHGDVVFKKEDEYSCHSKVLWDDLKNVSENDIISAQGDKYNKHPGNIQYNALICKTIADFVRAKTGVDRSAVVRHMLHQLVDKMGAKFIKQCPVTKKWYIMDRKMCHQKIYLALHGRITYQKRKALGCVMKKLAMGSMVKSTVSNEV